MKMENVEIKDFINDFSKINEIQSIVLGGSRATDRTDNISDYDFYVYSENEISSEIRLKLLSMYCKRFEIGNNYWELGDNGIFNCDIEVEIIYRNIDFFEKNVANVVEQFISYNGFTTCFWHNVLTSKIVFDRNGVFKKMKERFSIPYPQELKNNIIKRNMALLCDSLISYDKQITNAAYRKDLINMNNRITAFMASYFDIIFAINELLHPGEKRIMQICLNECKILPNNFENNINMLLNNKTEVINNIIYELKKILNYNL
jgi:predicted nucleotidyltransferase